MNKTKEAIIDFIKADEKRLKVIMIIGLAGIVLLFFSGSLTADKGNDKYNDKITDYSEYADELENELKDVISSIEGVGKCEVMITLENTKESVYATDSEIRNDEDSVENRDEYVLYDSGDSESPVLIKEYMPRVQGVTVVCSGGDNAKVREEIIEAVTALFNISANRVSVSKIK